MLDDDHVALVLVRDVELVEEEVRRLADAHRAHELAADPRAAAGSDAGLDDRDLEVGAGLGEDVGGRETGRAGADCEREGEGGQSREGGRRPGGERERERERNPFSSHPGEGVEESAPMTMSDTAVL